MQGLSKQDGLDDRARPDSIFNLCNKLLKIFPSENISTHLEEYRLLRDVIIINFCNLRLGIVEGAGVCITDLDVETGDHV